MLELLTVRLGIRMCYLVKNKIIKELQDAKHKILCFCACRITIFPESITMNGEAVHGHNEDRHVVEIGNLRVLVTEQNGEWFAQGVEIDYAASGWSLEEAQLRFERGLSATVDLHLRQFDSIERLLKFAPESVWCQLKAPQTFDFSLMTIHDLSGLGNSMRRLPFDRIAYLPKTRTRHAAAAQG
jgi:hypothetical protein